MARWQTSGSALLDQVLPAVRVPVLAAGADGVRVGTRFVAAAECPAHPVYLDGLVRAQAQDTVYTERFAGGWSIDAPHRVLRSCLEAADAFVGEIVGEEVEPTTGERVPVRRFRGDLAPTTNTTGHVEAMPQWAGESVGGVAGVLPAAAIVQELVSGAERLLGRWASMAVPA